jgi:hypothetical protein
VISQSWPIVKVTVRFLDGKRGAAISGARVRPEAEVHASGLFMSVIQTLNIPAFMAHCNILTAVMPAIASNSQQIFSLMNL